jgi:hypothetical protein
MKFSALVSTLLALGFSAGALAASASLSYDQTYDNSAGSLSTTACSDGSNGLASSYPTFGDLPKFPYIGGAQAIAGWNSAYCGTCWQLTYTDDKGESTSINVLAVDVAKDGFNIALAAMNALTNNLATQLGRITIDSSQVNVSICGL